MLRLSALRLNPCFNGRYSQSMSRKENGDKRGVLILVLMEDTLRVDILQEDVVSGRLNPCFNGRYSQRRSRGKMIKMTESS